MCTDIDGSLSCTSTPYGLDSDLAVDRLLQDPESVPVGGIGVSIYDITSTALYLQSNIFLSLLSGSAITFVLSTILILLIVYQKKKGKQVNMLERMTVSTLFLSTGVAITATVSITQTANSLQYITADLEDIPLITAGATLQALQWSVCACSVIFSAGIAFWVKRDGERFSPPKYMPTALPINRGALGPPPPPPPPFR